MHKRYSIYARVFAWYSFFSLSVIAVLMIRFCSKELAYIELLCLFLKINKLASIMYTTTQSYFADMQHKLVPTIGKGKQRFILPKFYCSLAIPLMDKIYYLLTFLIIVICMCQETMPRAVGKRTPRIPVSYTPEKDTRERYMSPVKKSLNQKGGDTDDDMEHEIALALTEASQRGGSTKNPHTPNRKSKMLSPDKKSEIMVIFFTVAHNSYIYFMKL